MNRPSLLAPLAWLALMAQAAVCTAADDAPLVDKTLIVWASPENLTQSGGTALTVNDTTIDRFDGVVFAEIEPQVWMPGSNGYSRTNKEQADWPKETAAPDRLVQMAIVYRGQQITVCRNGDICVNDCPHALFSACRRIAASVAAVSSPISSPKKSFGQFLMFPSMSTSSCSVVDEEFSMRQK